MEIKLLKEPIAELKGNVAVVSDNAPLSLSFISNYDLASAFVTLCNGSVKIENLPFKENFEVPKELLFEGRLLISVEMFIDGEVAKRWRVPPIRIKEANNTEFEAYPELSALIQLYFDLEKRIDALEKELKTHIKNSNEII
jgi:hypothetical protein